MILKLTGEQLAALPVDEGGHRWVRSGAIGVLGFAVLYREYVRYLCANCGAIRGVDRRVCCGPIAISLRKDESP
jgi:hypothetical protein